MEGDFFLKKAFHGRGQTFLGKLTGGYSTWRTNDQIMPWGREDLTNAFSSNLNIANLKISPNLDGIYT